ncbi:MAG TPA: PAS domain-containing protein [Phenylobacterium sp.]|uniref:sensor histidine kinase n=1 Tax=Phenylobacterium sp. TaxID=1871053 RepID=UPI002BFD1077|nr:PAS domain-containing protein [Phenylobacterium sp.]HSV01634.1 PAS domain-containing protein [Phenylobacterium sp.]
MDEHDKIGRSEVMPFAQVAEALGLGMAFQIQAGPGGEGRRFTYLSANCEALTGVPAEAALADPARLYDQILPEHREAFARAESEALAGDGRFEIEVRMRRADGEVRWRRIASLGRRLPDGGSTWDGLMSDVTEHRLAAQELAEQRRRLEVAVESTGLGFWEWDIRTGQLTWSDRNRAIFGLPPEAPVSIETYMAMVHPDDVDRIRQAFAAARDRPGGGDFGVEYRAVAPNGQMRWILTRGRVVADEAGAAMVVGTTLDTTSRREAEERRSLVMGELAHRAKNGIQVMTAIISETARSAEGVKDFEEVLVARLQAMAQSQDLVTAAGGRPVALYELAVQALGPFGLTRFDIEPTIAGLTVNGDVAAGLALLLHEMATNAVKYGALSRPEGRIALASGDAGPGMAALQWRERGGPRVEPSNRRGFGSRLLQAALRNQGGKVESAFDPDGFSARMEFRVSG